MRKRTLVSALIGLAALIGALLVARLVARQAQAQVISAPVVVARHVILPQTLITADLLTTREFPRAITSAPIYREPQELVGLVAPRRDRAGRADLPQLCRVSQRSAFLGRRAGRRRGPEGRYPACGRRAGGAGAAGGRLAHRQGAAPARPRSADAARARAGLVWSWWRAICGCWPCAPARRARGVR